VRISASTFARPTTASANVRARGLSGGRTIATTSSKRIAIACESAAKPTTSASAERLDPGGAGGTTISLVPDLTRVDGLVYVIAFVPESGPLDSHTAGADVRDMILPISNDDGNGCRSFNLERLASSTSPPGRRSRCRSHMGVLVKANRR
jgi:hypothetical protein